MEPAAGWMPGSREAPRVRALGMKARWYDLAEESYKHLEGGREQGFG